MTPSQSRAVPICAAWFSRVSFLQVRWRTTCRSVLTCGVGPRPVRAHIAPTVVGRFCEVKAPYDDGFPLQAGSRSPAGAQRRLPRRSVVFRTVLDDSLAVSGSDGEAGRAGSSAYASNPRHSAEWCTPRQGRLPGLERWHVSRGIWSRSTGEQGELVHTALATRGWRASQRRELVAECAPRLSPVNHGRAPGVAEP